MFEATCFIKAPTVYKSINAKKITAEKVFPKGLDSLWAL